MSTCSKRVCSIKGTHDKFMHPRKPLWDLQSVLSGKF